MSIGVWQRVLEERMPGPADNRRIDAFGTYEAEAEQALANPVIVPLLGRAVLRVAGEDASSFLHAQLTADIAALRPGDSTLAAWCTPKGRVIVTAHVARTEQDFLLVLSADLADKVLARLRMFVLRAKVTIEDASSRLAVMGYSGAGADDPVLEPPPPATLAPVHLRCAPSSVGPRSMLVGNAETLAAAWDECTTAGAVAVGEAVWDLLCLLAAEPTIGAVASEAHLPQMLNLDVLAAVSFSKGCYPGQEIVARTQYLGQLKRRLMLLEGVCESPPAAATGLYGESQDSVVGEVVMAARDATPGSCLVLAVVRLEVADQELHVGVPTGPRLASRCLPYALPSG